MGEEFIPNTTINEKEEFRIEKITPQIIQETIEFIKESISNQLTDDTYTSCPTILKPNQNDIPKDILHIAFDVAHTSLLNRFNTYPSKIISRSTLIKDCVNGLKVFETKTSNTLKNLLSGLSIRDFKNQLKFDIADDILNDLIHDTTDCILKIYNLR
jgi:hypothetical protein